MQNTIKLSLLSVALLSQLHAADEITLKPLAITSTAIKTDELKSTDAVEVYTAKDIEKAHVQNLYEFLNKETSVITAPGYGNPFTQKIDMHGYGITDGYQNIVITINGRKLNNIDMVPQLLGSIAPSSIARIEIIKSSGIVENGDGSNAGVINIITKNSNNKEITFYGGTYNTEDGSFYVGQSSDKLSLSASGEAQRNGGIRHVSINNDKDSANMSTGTFNLSYTPINEIELRLGAAFAKTDVFYGGILTKSEYKKDPTKATTLGYESHQKYDTNSISAGISYYINDTLTFEIDANHEKKKSQYVPYSPSNYIYDSAKAHFDYEKDDLYITAGADIFDGERDGYGNKTSKDNLAGYLQARYTFDNNTFKAGYRHESVNYKYRASAAPTLKDDHQLDGAELGYNYMLNKTSSLFANYSHSYQAPDIDRFFATTYPPPTYSPVVSFNKFINPMQANNYTLGYNNIQDNNKFKVSIYYIDLKDEIYYYFAGYSNPATKNTNIDKSHKYGLDFYDKFIVNQKFNLAVNYNYVQAIIDKEKQNGEDFSGNKLPGVSNHNVKATLNYLPNERTTLSLTHVYRSEAYAADDFNNDFSQKQDAYNSTDIAATYSTKKWEIFAKINNLFNQKNGLWIKNDAIYPVNFTTTAMAGFKLKY
jgi:iron complex outermembrane receptor protein